MLDSDTPILHTITGRYFEAMIWKSGPPASYQVFLRVRDVTEGCGLFDTRLDLGSEHLEELKSIAHTAGYIVRLPNRCDDLDAPDIPGPSAPPLPPYDPTDN